MKRQRFNKVKCCACKQVTHKLTQLQTFLTRAARHESISFCRLLTVSSASFQTGASSPPDHKRPGGSGSPRVARHFLTRENRRRSGAAGSDVCSCLRKTNHGLLPLAARGKPEVENGAGPVQDAPCYSF